MLKLTLLGLFLWTCLNAEINAESTKVLSRRKRYVSFPDGSSFSIAGCITVGIIGQPAPATAPGTFTLGLNWAIAYELPNTTETVALYVKKFKKDYKDYMHRRSRKDLYQKLETILNNIGYDGRQCILKTLCETVQRITPHGTNMMEEIFRILFTMPATKLLTSEPMEHAVYDSAHRLGSIVENCDSMFTCPISLVDWAKGYYDTLVPSGGTEIPWNMFSNSFSYM